ncbi:MAG: phosphoribosylglycinamide formyltransferase [Desulfuromonadales bacterium]|nr:phosphoribosylglycinamide formyltransferase [Desulfuromonadales bacterium]
MKKPYRIAVLASGGGTNLQSIIDQQQTGELPITIALVISNNPGAGALERAQQAGISTLCINHRDYPTRENFDRALVNALQQAEVDLVVLAGFMRIITPIMLTAFPQRIINIHPALLPSFPGLNVQQQAIDYGARFSGCTVHFVDADVDTGPIIIQAVVPILAEDSAATLAERILEQEHRIYPQAIQWLAEGRVTLDGRKVIITDSRSCVNTLTNPTH